jgi:Kef-type K+ transport system membrane component KefB
MRPPPLGTVLMLPTKSSLLLTACTLIFVPWLIRRVSVVQRFLPLAVIQILIGVLLGPSCLGRLAPSYFHALFPTQVLGPIDGLATVGVLLFVFVSGLHLDAAQLRGRVRTLSGAALGSLGVPMTLGFGVGIWIAKNVPGTLGSRAGVDITAASIAICLAVTALPVLAAILRELDLMGSALGQTALALAAVNDAALWVMIAVLLALALGNTAEAVLVLGLTGLWLAAMLLVVRPLLARIAARRAPDAAMLVVSLGTAFGSAALSQSFGLGYLIGGFVAGAVVPAQRREVLLAQLEPLTATVLLPFFFLDTGLRTIIEPDSSIFLGMFAVLSLAGITGKVFGTALPARYIGEEWSSALALGGLMQTKGLMEVVVLSMLLDEGLIGRNLFSALIAMAVLCTLLTAPMVRLSLGPNKMREAADA